MSNLKGIYLHIDMLGMTFSRSPMMQIVSQRHRPVSVAAVTLSDAMGDVYRAFAPDQPVSIQYGYRGEAPATWTGLTTTRKAVGKDQIEVGCVGMDRSLITSQIKLIWENEAPDAIMRHAIRLAGLTPGRVDIPGSSVVVPKFISGNGSLNQVAIQLSHTLTHAFDLDMSRWALWMDMTQNVVHWGDFDREGETPAIETGSALLQHTPASDQRGLHLVETFLMAGYEHSRAFRLIDQRRQIDQTYRALTVRHEVSENSRTFIEYGEEYDQL
jgi:hypothetical protein